MAAFEFLLSQDIFCGLWQRKGEQRGLCAVEFSPKVCLGDLPLVSLAFELCVYGTH